jgi:hypothetical protein
MLNQLDTSKSNHHPTAQRQPGFQDSWWDLLLNFSQGKLTDESDKLVAFSDIAREMRQCLFEGIDDVIYLAGLWSENLAEQLRWRVHQPAQFLSRYRAHSWPWLPSMVPSLRISSLPNTLILSF